MATEVQIALQPQAGQDPAAALAAAAAKLARSSLAALIQQAGQPLTGKVVVPQANLPAGFVQIAVAEQVLTLKLSMPLPAGMPVRIDVQPSTNGQPAVTVQPLPRAVVTQPPPPPVQLQALAQPNTSTPQSAAPQPQALPVAPAAAGSPPPVASPTPPAPQPAAQPQMAAPAPQPAQTPSAASQPSQPTAAPATTPPPAGGSTPLAQMPAPSPVAVSTPAPALVATAQVAAPAAAAAPAVGVGVVAGQQMPTAPATPVATQAPVPAAPSMAPSPVPQQVAAPIAQAATAAPSSPALAAQVVTQTSTPSPSPTQPTVPIAASPSAAPPAAMMQRLTQAFAPAQPATTAPAALPGSPAQLTMVATTQAAAQQQSVAPLMQALAVVLPALPKEVADAAAKVLAARVSLDRGAPTGDAVKQAVLKSGVFVDPAKAGAQPDVRQALTQLRGTLMAWLGDDIAPVAAVTRRPPPPGRGALPRAQGPELPQPPVEGGAKEAGKSLLGQAEGALSRLKLLQLTSQPADAARPGAAALAAPTEWNLEIPMMLGRELAMAQFQIQRDGKNKSDTRDKSWRLRFAINLSLVGEVGAQVTMSGTRAAVALWADQPNTAETLEAMLPELGPALTAKGLDLTSLVVRRGAPRDESQPVGRLMDSRR